MGWDDVILSGVSTIAGAIIAVIYDRLKDRYKFRKELENNSNIVVTGEDWIAAWQTSVDRHEVLNTERIALIQNGGIVKIYNKEKSPENPKAGYFWSGQMHFFQGRDLLGWYFAKSEENSSAKGMLYLTYDSARKEFIGKWVGCSYDGPLMTGFAAVSKSKERSLEILTALLKRHPHRVSILSYTQD